MDEDKSQGLRELSEVAAKLVQNPNIVGILSQDIKSDHPLLHLLDQHFVEAEARGSLLLPDLNAFQNRTLAVFSDYAGEGSGSHYTYSFLICAWDSLGAFEKRISHYRGSTLPDREISFKKFSSKAMTSILPEYLRALDTLVHGLLFTLVVPKSLSSLFGSSGTNRHRELAEEIERAGFGSYKGKVAEKLLRIVYVSSFLTALLIRGDQKVFWMTDHDAICSNDTQRNSLLYMFQNALNACLGERSNRFIAGAVPFQETNLLTLDLLSAADVSASTLEHYLTLEEFHKHGNFTVKQGAPEVLQWLARDGLALKKRIFKIVEEGGGYRGKSLHLRLTNPIDNSTVVPIALKNSTKE